jgi:hypothetical protein
MELFYGVCCGLRQAASAIAPSHLCESATEPEAHLLQFGSGLAVVYLAIIYAYCQRGAKRLSRLLFIGHGSVFPITHRRKLQIVFFAHLQNLVQCSDPYVMFGHNPPDHIYAPAAADGFYRELFRFYKETGGKRR